MNRHLVLAAASILAIWVGPARADGYLGVAAVQTEVRFYASAGDFTRHMAERVEAAMKRRPHLIVFPEDIATPLVALGDYDLVNTSKSLAGLTLAISTRHASELAPICAKYKVSPQRALFLLRSESIRRVYSEAFRALAARYRVTIVAGSAPLTSPDRPGQVFNTSCIFTPAGDERVLARKVNIVPLEGQAGLDLSAGKPEDSRVFRLESLTPAVTIGCLICADAWQADLAERLAKRGAQVLLQVSANPGAWGEDTRQGWRNSLFSRVQECGVYGVTAMGVGGILDVPFQGQSAVVAPRAWTTDGTGIIAEAQSATGEAVVYARLKLPGGPGGQAGSAANNAWRAEGPDRYSKLSSRMVS